MAIELQPGETALGDWTVYHEPSGGRAVTGKLHITSQRVLFDAQMEAGGRGMRQARQAFSSNWKANNSLAIDRGQVTAIDSKKGFFSKKVMLTTANGTTHVFNRGMMSVDPILAALGRG